MGTVWQRVGIEAAAVVVSLSVVSAAYWGGVALLGSDTNTSEKSDVFTVTTPTETTAPAAPTTEVPPTTAVPPPVVTQPATVEDVPKPETTPKPAAPPAAIVDPESIGTVGPDGVYTAAPPPQKPGEPPVASNWGAPPPQEGKLPGEPGYVRPTGD